MTHIFVVNDQTFRYHLEYLFAGTCASADALFINDVNYHNPRRKDDGLTSKQELTIAGMIADVSRIRPGDKILFYLTQSKYHEGMFFGVFKAKEFPFFDSNNDNYLSQELGVNLNFRVLIEQDIVYPFGISEHTALDSLDGITHPSQMCWSMIYRKLKGKRGCTMVTDYEAERLIRLISDNNSYNLTGNNFSFNQFENCIEITDRANVYQGSKADISMKERMLVKASRNLAYEAHLQAYIIQNCDKSPLKELTGQIDDLPLWIGNEVSCGVGMQSIDIMLCQENAESIFLNIIELKCVEPYESIITYQLPWYVSWVKDYLAPLYNKRVVITPIILAPKIRDAESMTRYINKCRSFSSETTGNIVINPIVYIGYTIDTDIHFEKLL